MKPRLISGIKPTGPLHVGNYLGALKNFISLQNTDQYECFFFIADLHSLTEGLEPNEVRKNTLNVVLDYLASGLDPKKSTIFVQSMTPTPTELAWIFNAITPVPELERMTQYKDWLQKMGKKAPNVGLLTYPTLMAADILLYGPQFVPVGDDQLQHLELTRTIARNFNKKYGKEFVEPQPLMTNVPRLMSLNNPTKKMSKSEPTGCLFIDDEPDQIRSKVKRAVTDSGTEIKYDPKKKPALANLISIYSALTTWNAKTVEMRFKNTGYGEFKSRLAELIIRHLEPFQKKKKELSKNADSVKRILVSGAKVANEIANQKITEVKKRVGFFA